MLANKYGSQTYFYIYDWEEFDAKRIAYSKKGYLLTSICSNKSGFAAIMSKVPSWSHESRTTRWASGYKNEDLDQQGTGPITSLFIKDDMATSYSHQGTGIVKQHMLVPRVNAISNEVLNDIMNIHYVITDIAVWNSKMYIVCSKGLDWKQNVSTVSLENVDGYLLFDHEPGTVVTEFLPLGDKVATLIFSASTTYREQLTIINPMVEQLKESQEDGYRMSMVRGLGDNLYVFLVR